MEHGDLHLAPVLSSTSAPAGVVSMTKTSVVPRVMVAHPVLSTAITPMAHNRTWTFLMTDLPY
jgi:hypothetical protein